MTESIQHFALKTIGRSRCNGRKPCTLTEAARHNLREIQAEIGASGHIDPSQMADNTILAGPASACEVQAVANALLAAVDTTKLKRDHVQAVEIIFSLPPDSVVASTDFFARCLEWVESRLPLPVLLATVHHDEAAPHMHVLLLPVKNGKHIGGALNTRPELKRLRESFFTQVAGPAGLKRDGAKVRGVVKQWAVAAVVARCEGMGLPPVMGPLWPIWIKLIERDPTAAMLALGIDLNALRQFSESSASIPIGLQPSPIGLDSRAIVLQKAQALSCVGLHQQATLAGATKAASAAPDEPPANQPEAIETLEEMWMKVGCISKWMTPTKAERMRRARDAQQRAIDRHHNKPAAAMPAGTVHVDEDGLTRERDEFSHDTTAWND